MSKEDLGQDVPHPVVGSQFGRDGPYRWDDSSPSRATATTCAATRPKPINTERKEPATRVIQPLRSRKSQLSRLGNSQ